MMTAIQMNAELLRNMSIIAEDESLLSRAAKYLRKLVKEKEQTQSLMTKEQFFDRIDKANKGELYDMLPNENLTDFLRRQGYEV